MTDLFKTRIENFYSNMEKIDIEIEKLQKSKTKLYWDKSVLKTELELYYNYMIGKKAVCLTENGTHIYKCTKVLISDDFKPLPKFSNDNYKKVSVLDFDWI